MSDARPVAALILAAGRGRRFGSDEQGTKAVVPVRGVPMVRRVADVALASRARPVVVVTGHAATSVEAALEGLPVAHVHNPDYVDGLAGSLRRGLVAFSPDIAGVLVLLADMPLVAASTLDALIAAFVSAPAGIDAVVPMHAGRPGNPLLLARSLFPRLMQLQDDQGARSVLEAEGRMTVTVDVADGGIVIDVDTPADLRALDRL